MKKTNREEEGGRDGYHIHRFYIELMLPLADLQRQPHLSLASLLTRQCFKVSRNIRQVSEMRWILWSLEGRLTGQEEMRC